MTDEVKIDREESFKVDLAKAELNLVNNQCLVVKEPVLFEDTGEVIFDGAIYTVKNKFPSIPYRTRNDLKGANLGTEVCKGVSKTDSTGYVDNRLVIERIMRNVPIDIIGRYVHGDGMRDDDDSYDEDYDVDALEDLERLTIERDAAEAIAEASSKSQGQNADKPAKEEERGVASDDDDKGASNVT